MALSQTPHTASAALLELVPDIIYEYRLAPPPGFVYVTPSVTAIVGYTPEEHYADPELGRRIVHPDDLPRLDAIAADPDEDRVHLIRWRTRSGGEVTTAQRVRAIRDANGTVTGVIGVCRPITDGEPSWLIRLGPLCLDLASNEATVDGRTLSLTPSERQILTLLVSAQRTVGRRELVELLWGTYHESGERTVEVHVSNLRKKLDDRLPGELRVVTVRGVGYRLADGGTPHAGQAMATPLQNRPGLASP